jgi:membrane protein implicated in regulation of membrane protease activity
MDELALFLPAHTHLLWLIAALALAASELLTGGFVLAAWLGASVNEQLFLLGVTSLVLFAGSRTIFRRVLMAGGAKVETNADAMIGRCAEVVSDVGPGCTDGSVKVNGEIWSARSTGTVLRAGTQVVIEKIDGLKLLVRDA